MLYVIAASVLMECTLNQSLLPADCRHSWISGSWEPSWSRAPRVMWMMKPSSRNASSGMILSCVCARACEEFLTFDL